MLSGKFMKFETTTTEKKAHKNHLSRSQVVGRFVQNSEINLTTTIRCLIRHWKTGCLQLTWQYFDRKFLDSREMVFVFSGKTWGGGGGVNPWKTACLGIFLFGFSAFFFFGKISQTPPVFAAVFHRGLRFFFTPKMLMTSRTSLMFWSLSVFSWRSKELANLSRWELPLISSEDGGR